MYILDKQNFLILQLILHAGRNRLKELKDGLLVPVVW